MKSVATVIVFLVLAIEAGADDWPQWGGPQRDLVWRESGIVKKIPEGGLLPRVWSSPVGEGYSGPAVAGGKVFITDLVDRDGRDGKERVLCLDAQTGKRLWDMSWSVRYGMGYPAGPRATPTVAGNRVLILGAVGHLFCLDVESGRILWRKNYVREYKLDMPRWGTASPPLVDGDQVFALVGGKDGALVVCFDLATGGEVWRSLKSKGVGYCPPVIFTFGGVRQLIIWHPTAVSSLDLKTGKPIWQIPFEVRYGLCIGTPRRIGNRVFVTSFYNGSRMIRVSDDGRSAKVAWKGKSNSEKETDGLHSIISTPFVDETSIFGVCSYGQLRCLETATGKRVWKSMKATGSDRWWNAFIIPHEDRFFIHNEQGDLILAKLTPEGYEEQGRAKLVEPTRKVRRRMTIWSHPAFAMKSVFARNDREIVRVDLSEK